MKLEKKWEIKSKLNRELVGKYAGAAFIVVCLIYLLAIGFFRYDTNDDFFLYLFTGGALGKYVNYSIYNNVFMSGFLAFISRVLRGINVNLSSVYYFIGIALSYVFLSVWLSKKKGSRGAVESILFFLMSVGTIMNAHNYSKTGALIMIVGTVIFANYKKEDHILWKIISALLLVTGSLYRAATTKAVIPFAVLCFAYGLWNSKKANTIKPYLCRWAIVSVLIILFWAGDYWFYNINPQMVEFTEFNTYRTDITDYGIPDWNSYQAEFEAIGWSSNDCQNLSEWNFADKNTYTVDSLKAVTEIGRDTRSITSIRKIGRMVIDLLAAIPATLFLCIKQPTFWGIVVQLVLAFLANKWNGLWAFLAVAFTGGELWMLQYAGRTPERAIMVPLLCGFATICMFETKKVHWGVEVAFIIAIFVACSIYKFPTMGRKVMPVQKLMNECLDEISDNQSNLYLWDIFTFAENAEKAYGPFDRVKEGYLSNSTFIGGWIIPAPAFVEKTEEFGAEGNVIRLLTLNKNVYYISKDEPSRVLMVYLYEHYGYNQTPTVVEDWGRFKIYSFAE